MTILQGISATGGHRREGGTTGENSGDIVERQHAHGIPGGVTGAGGMWRENDIAKSGQPRIHLGLTLEHIQSRTAESTGA